MLIENRGGTAIFIDFDLPKHSVTYIIEATNQTEKITALNGELRMNKGRIYYLPIDNKEINTDDHTYIKMFSNLSDKINVVFVKEGFACVIPLVHNIKIRNGQRICNIV